MNSPKVVFITGTSRGLGLALKRSLEAAGHDVVGSSRAPAVGSSDLALDVVINSAGTHLHGAALETSVSSTAPGFPHRA